MNEESKFKKFIAKIKRTKHIEIIVAVVAVLIMLLVYFSTKVNFSSKANEDTTTKIQSYCEKIERELTETLSVMKGVGKTKIVINWESSVEKLIAYITNNSPNSSTSTPSIIQSGGSQSPIVLKEIYPKAVGVIIVCVGGDDVKTKINVINAVSVLLNITPEKINVYAMNNK